MSGETENQLSGWTVDTLRYAINQQLQDLREMLNERYATQVKAVDQAFLAQTTAMATAFTAADKAVQAALESAEKAVTKAENAAEKRFEAVNEFRGQLNDQALTFLARSEADVRLNALGEKIDAGVSRNAQGIIDLEQRSVGRYGEVTNRISEMDNRHLQLMNDMDKRLTSRLDLTAGQVAGKADQHAQGRMNTSLGLAAATFLAFCVSVGVAIFVAIHG